MKNKRRQKLPIPGMKQRLSLQTTDIKSIKEHYKQLYTHKVDILHEMDQLIEKHKP